MSHEEHRRKAKKRLRFALITVSTSRYENPNMRDKSGDLAKDMVKEKGHKVVYRDLIPDDMIKIRSILYNILKEGITDVVLLIGGTGASSSDVTTESVEPLLDKVFPGFGELFRLKGYEEIGAASLLSRALMGTIKGHVVICLPGSEGAVRLGLNIILDELPHLVSIAQSK
jgi:molybdenum cofactor biosynthesis protein B